MGCYTATPLSPDAVSDAPPPVAVRRVCAEESECLPGEICRLFPNSGPDRLCALPCTATLINSLCDNGQICFGASDSACYPGVDPSRAPAECTEFFDCPAGFGCSTLGPRPGPGGFCSPATCRVNADCERGFACGTRNTCVPICHPLDPWTCPTDTVCFLGGCHTLDDARDCSQAGPDTPIVPDNCPLGTYCGGNDNMWECFTPEQLLERSPCRSDQAGSIYGCVDRRTR